MKRALIAASVLLLGAALWWSLSGPKPPAPLTGTPDSRPTLDPSRPTLDPSRPDSPAAVTAIPDAGPPPPLPTLRGEVRDDSGGVAQAIVELRRRGAPDAKENECTSKGSTTSVSGGAFDFGPLCPGQYDVRATRGSRVATAVARLARGSEHDPLFLLLRDGTRLTVRARDGSRAPVAGALITVQDEDNGYLAEGETDEKGVATVEGLTPRPHTVRGSKPGFIEASVHDRTLAPGDDQVDLTLLAGVFFAGRVVDPDGEGVDDVWVRLSLRRKELGGGFDSVDGANSSDGGEFSIGPVRPGPYTLVATHDLYTRFEQAVRVPGPRALVKLGRGATVEGLFLDADGAPVFEGDVHAELAGNEDSRSGAVDAFGRFRLEGLGRGEWALVGMTKSTDGGPQGIAVLQLPVKQETKLSVTLQLLRGERIEGRCVTTSGAKADTDVIAIEESLFTKLRLSGVDPTRVPPGTVALSSCSDRFVLEGLKPGRYALLACGNDEQPDTASAGDRDVTVTCREGLLRFRVVDEAGRPIERYSTWGPGSAADPHPGGRYETSKTGEIDEVLSVWAPGFAPLQRKLSGKRGAVIDLGDLTLTPARRLTGRVTSARDGQPVAGAELRFGVDRAASLQRARTRSDGAFELDDVPREAGQLFVTHPAFRQAAVDVPPAAAQVNVALEAGLELSGAVITHDGREPLGFTVEARGPGAATLTADVAGGRYAIGSLEPGDWKLRLVGPDVSAFDPLTVTLVGSGAVTADFVERLGGVSVSVLPVDDEGRPIIALAWLIPGTRALPATDAEAWALSNGAGIGSEGDPSGAHHFASVQPGSYTVMVRVKEIPGLVWVVPLEVNPGMVQQRLVMPRGLEPLKR